VNLLLDTHIVLWSAGGSSRLSRQIKELLLDPANQLYFSAASLWEITIKRTLGRSDFQVDPRRLWRMLPAHGHGKFVLTPQPLFCPES
jgi:PIN domain nuclease of toxin-antitoxin system